MTNYLMRLLVPESLPSIFLVLVGVGGIIVAIKSLGRVDRQIGEIRRQIEVTLAQLRAMQEQVTQMSEQTRLLQRYVTDTEKIANAGLKSADAALLNAESVINAERAWLTVELRCKPGTSVIFGTGQGGETTAVMDVELWCVNNGKSPAWIKEKQARLIVVAQENIPEAPPQFDKDNVIDDKLESVGPGQDCKVSWNPVGTGRRTTDKVALIYGVVRYSDIFNKNRETWFGYKLDGFSNARSLSRLSGHPDYNKYS